MLIETNNQYDECSNTYLSIKGDNDEMRKLRDTTRWNIWIRQVLLF
jgi:hypothetical protein